jgi:type I restriction enzyme, S subunit
MKTIKSLTEAEIAELPTLPDEWRWVKIGNLTFGIEYGTSTKSEKLGQVPVLRMGNIQNGRFDWNDLVYTNNKAEIEKYLLKKDDVLFNRTNSPELVGKTAIYKGERTAIFAGYLIRINRRPELVDADYLNYFLNCPIAKIHGNSVKTDGVNQSNINGEKLGNYPFPFSPPPEQRAIVSKIEQLFSELDNGIANLKLAQEQLKVYRQAVLKKAFEGELTRKWREQQIDLPDVDDMLEQISREQEKVAKATGKKMENVKFPTEAELAKLPMIPEEWIWVKLDYLGDLGRGKSKHRPRNDKILFGGKYPFIQTGEVKAANHIIKSFENTYSDFGLSQSKLWPKGTLCITIAANIAETAFLGFEGCFPDSIVGFTAKENLVVKEYVYYFFKGNQSKIEAFAPATAQKNINLNILENLLIPFCSLLEQQAIVQEIETRLSVCDKIEQENEANLERAEALRQSILKKAFEGKLLNEKELAEVRKAEDWEPAEVLLEKIKAEKAGYKKKLENW